MGDNALQILEDKRLPSQFRGKLPEGVKLRFAVEKEHVRQLIVRNQDLQDCLPQTVHDAMLNAAMIGLSFNPNLGEAYLIPRKIYKGKGRERQYVCTVAQLYVGYKGMQAVVNRAGTIKWLKARVVYANEPFELIEGIHTDIRHKIEKDAKKRGHMVGAYCIAMTADNEPLVEYMDADQIGRVREYSESKDSDYSPWKNFPEQQWKKSVIRRAWNQWPKSPALDVLVSMMNEIEGTDPKEKEVEAVVCISDDQYTELHDMVLEAFPGADPAKWLAKLAKTFGQDHITDIPDHRFDEVKETLKLGIKSQKAKSA